MKLMVLFMYVKLGSIFCISDGSVHNFSKL